MSIGLNSVVVGGRENRAFGDYPIAFGTNTIAGADNSMLINLIDSDGDEQLVADKIGQFIVKFPSY